MSGLTVDTPIAHNILERREQTTAMMSVETDNDVVSENNSHDDSASEDSDHVMQTDMGELMAHFPDGCQHYRRRCALVCSDCGEEFVCRHCHDEKWELHADRKKAHKLDRSKVKEIVCIPCGHRQEVTESSKRCSSCGVEFGKYFCLSCRFWDQDEAKEHFHCDGCGMCRVGGRENYFHCNTCRMCLSVRMRDSHSSVCRPNLLNQDCSICFEDLFTSTKPSTVLRCGHPIHTHCCKLYAKHKSTCPLCKKMFVANNNPRVQEFNLQVQKIIDSNPIPRDMAKNVWISCIECEVRSQVSWHPTGNRCTAEGCGSFNTSILSEIEVPNKQP